MPTVFTDTVTTEVVYIPTTIIYTDTVTVEVVYIPKDPDGLINYCVPLMSRDTAVSAVSTTYEVDSQTRTFTPGFPSRTYVVSDQDRDSEVSNFNGSPC